MVDTPSSESNERDEMSLVPEYEFAFENEENRLTSDIEEADRFPEAIEYLAQLGRDDPECTVNLKGLAN